MEIAGKVAVVSGGGSGIGRAAVLALVDRGAKVVVADIDADAGRQTVDLAAKKAGTAVFARCDVTKTADLAGTFACAVEHFGRLDIAFNNAGIGDEDLFADDPGEWARVIAVDLTAVIDATRLAVRELQRAGHGGVIINTASLIGLGPMARAPVYAAAKAGVVNFSRSLAYLAEESTIRVNATCPEIVDTPMVLGLGRGAPGGVAPGGRNPAARGHRGRRGGTHRGRLACWGGNAHHGSGRPGIRADMRGIGRTRAFPIVRQRAL